MWQLNRNCIEVKVLKTKYISVCQQTHLGKLSVSMLPCNFFVLVSWKKLLWGMIAVVEHLTKQMEFPSYYRSINGGCNSADPTVVP